MPAVRRDRARRSAAELPVLGDPHRDRRERAVPDATQARTQKDGGGLAAARSVFDKEIVMFITKKSVPRRRFLQGIGASLALPLLDAMVPASTRCAKTAAAPARCAGSGRSSCRWAR